jgi:hypothetical protein
MIELVGNKLAIFERFVTDNNLPKHIQKKVVRQGQRFVMTPDYVEEDGMEEDGDQPADETFSAQFGQVIWKKQKQQASIGVIKKVVKKVVRYFDIHRKEEPELSPEDTMKIVFENAQQLETFKAKQETIENLIKTAQENGQIALVEDLQKRQSVLMYESALIVLGYPRYISEEAIVKLAKMSKKAFRLDFIKNFVRIIPETAAEKKKALDKALIFDNYAILHYDPSGKSNKLTEAEIQAKRDPILFGMIKDSRRLYFVADWIDKLCTLTFEELMQEMERCRPADDELPGQVETTLKEGVEAI